MGQQKTEDRKQKTGAASPRPSRKVWWGLAVLIIVAVGGFAWMRVGMLDLPSVPSTVTREARQVIVELTGHRSRVAAEISSSSFFGNSLGFGVTILSAT